MENKVRKNNLKNMKNINIKMGVDSDRITKLKEFYNTKIKKTHIICMTIMVVIFVLVFIVNIGMYKSGANIIPDIAREVGCPDASYFYRKFKQYYGVSPASLRSMKKY